MEMAKLQGFTQKGLTTLKAVVLHVKPMCVKGVPSSKLKPYISLPICFI